jgi:hypothetical protein
MLLREIPFPDYVFPSESNSLAESPGLGNTLTPTPEKAQEQLDASNSDDAPSVVLEPIATVAPTTRRKRRFGMRVNSLYTPVLVVSNIYPTNPECIVVLVHKAEFSLVRFVSWNSAPVLLALSLSDIARSKLCGKGDFRKLALAETFALAQEHAVEYYLGSGERLGREPTNSCRVYTVLPTGKTVQLRGEVRRHVFLRKSQGLDPGEGTNRAVR